MLVGNKNHLPYIKEIYAYLSIDEDGDEGVCGFHGPNGWMPMVGADEARVKSLLPYAEQIARESDKKIKLVKFTTREDIKIIGE